MNMMIRRSYIPRRYMPPLAKARYYGRIYKRRYKPGRDAVGYYLNDKIGRRCHDLEWEYDLDQKGLQKKGIEIATASANGLLDERKCMENLSQRLNLRDENVARVFEHIKNDFDSYFREIDFAPFTIVFMEKETARIIAEFELLGDDILKKPEKMAFSEARA